MSDDGVSTTTVINAPTEPIFAVFADPATHAAIDGTGSVRQALDSKPLSATGQIFRMSMYHPNRPDGNYQMANRVQVFDPPSAISWDPENEAGEGFLSLPGWTWHYDLAPVGPSNTTVTLSYGWSAVPEPIREHIGFSPFSPEHLGNSLAHLAELVAGDQPALPPASVHLQRLHTQKLSGSEESLTNPSRRRSLHQYSRFRKLNRTSSSSVHPKRCWLPDVAYAPSEPNCFTRGPIEQRDPYAPRIHRRAACFEFVNPGQQRPRGHDRLETRQCFDSASGGGSSCSWPW